MNLPIEILDKIATFSVELSRFEEIQRCIDRVDGELMFQMRNMSVFNHLMVAWRMLTVDQLVSTYNRNKEKYGKKSAKRTLKKFLIRYADKRIAFARKHTPHWMSRVSAYTIFHLVFDLIEVITSE